MAISLVVESDEGDMSVDAGVEVLAVAIGAKGVGDAIKPAMGFVPAVVLLSSIMVVGEAIEPAVGFVPVVVLSTTITFVVDVEVFYLYPHSAVLLSFHRLSQ